MAKTNTRKILVNGEIADADDVNQIVENTGSEGGSLPYDVTTHTRDTLGNEPLGTVNYPWGDIFVNDDAYLKEVDTVGSSVAASVLFSNLRKFIFLKDAPGDGTGSYAGHAGKSAVVSVGEDGLDFDFPANRSNVLFQYNGQVDASASARGEYVGTSLNPNAPTGTYRFLLATSTSYVTIWTTRWTKLPGVSTITILVRGWVRVGTPVTWNVKVDVGGQNGNVSGTVDQTTPEWKSFTIDVSSLTNGNVYDVTASMRATDNTETLYCSNIVAIGS